MNRHWEDNRVRLMNSEVPRKADNAQVVQTLNQAPESVLLVNAAGVIELANEAAIGPALNWRVAERDRFALVPVARLLKTVRILDLRVPLARFRLFMSTPK